ncbi:lactonase family protein [Deinococcus cellulosilyticus]|uniref:6-phosphogluconolactonase n=1 Tax=Deinococcus cellulosilyticus (strain DSM 18568 / NBRC 106333 / KACC 11606 / 5516J-15) TaxID=1223518 RepID=A0A511NB57_DEIC1|nr:lactonase family protein [Deinococcus cellulosilyticus]GEM49758.1 6-phosphogluconolactonase [Deinococcus cellulosilyticus NBRC 106333 = KACC 11606]
MTQHRFYVGTYTQDVPHIAKSAGKGIYVLDLDSTTGQLTEATLAAELVNPSFVAVHPDRKTVLAVSETEQGTVSSFQVKEDGTLQLTSTQSAIEGATCFVSTDLEGKLALVANYMGEVSVLAYPITEEGALLPHQALDRHEHHTQREGQDSPHAHCIRSLPGGRYVAATNLGTDEVYVYDLQGESGPLSRVHIASFPEGSGPRHIQFDASGKLAYVCTELSSQLVSLRVEPETGVMLALNIASTLPEDAQGTENSTSEVLVSPEGHFVYVGNRGHDSIAVFQVQQDTGELELLSTASTQGKGPRGMALSPDGQFLLAGNQDSDTIMVFRRDAQEGGLEPVGLFPCPTPVSLAFVPET